MLENFRANVLKHAHSFDRCGEKINSWVSFSFPYEYGAPLGGPSGRGAPLIYVAYSRK